MAKNNRITPEASKLDLDPSFIDPNGNHWNVPKIGNYASANSLGAAYAEEYVQYLLSDPSLVGMPVLGFIAQDMDYSDEDRRGICVGFFSRLEALIYEGALAREKHQKAA